MDINTLNVPTATAPSGPISLPVLPKAPPPNPENLPRPQLGNRAEAAGSRPTWLDLLANGIKRHEDPIVDKLDTRAYEYIRTTDLVSYPLRKLAMQVSSRVLTVNGDSAQAAFLQQCIDDSYGVPDMLRWMVLYGGPEGVTFIWMKDAIRNGHLVVDVRGGGRHKANAGGKLVLTRDLDPDTREPIERVVKQLEDSSVSTVADKPEEYPRERFIIYRPGGGNSPEGDSEFGWQLYLLARAAQVNDRNWDDFGEKYVLPVWLVRAAMGDATPGNSYARINTLARQVTEMPQGAGLAVPEDVLVQLMQANNTGPLIMELREKAVAARAHKLVLHNELTSTAVQGEGRGDTAVARGEQDLVVEAECLAICECLTGDLLGYIKRRAQELGQLPPLLPGEKEPWLSLEPAAEENRIAGADLDAMRKTDHVETDWYYEQRGAPRPEGLPDVLEPNTSALDPLAGLGLPGLDFGGQGQGGNLPGNGPAPAGAPAKPMLPPGLRPAAPEPTRERKPILPGLTSRQRKALLLAGETEINELKALVSVARRKLGDLFRAEFERAAEAAAMGVGFLLSERTTDMLAKLAALVDLAGRARLFRELRTLQMRARLAGERPTVAIEASIDLPFAQAIQDFTTRAIVPISEISAALAPTVAQKVALIYRDHGFTMAKVPERRMLEVVHNKLVEFLQTGDNDRKQFAKWFVEQNPDLPDTYADVVFRNNVNTAYSAGRYQQMREAGDLVGGWQYVTAGDDAVRPAHAALDGKVFPMSRADLMPPLGHNCRCTAIPVEPGAAVMRGDEIERLVSKVNQEDPQFVHWQGLPGGDAYGGA